MICGRIDPRATTLMKGPRDIEDVLLLEGLIPVATLRWLSESSSVGQHCNIKLSGLSAEQFCSGELQIGNLYSL